MVFPFGGRVGGFEGDFEGVGSVGLRFLRCGDGGWWGGFFSPGEGGKGLSYRGYSLQMSISGMKEISL